jgi:hypothetical protein
MLNRQTIVTTVASLSRLGAISFRFPCNYSTNQLEYHSCCAFNVLKYIFLKLISRTYQIARSVQVYKTENEYLGLTIAGGKDTCFDKIFIKSVIPYSSAARSKKLRSGDMILSVDGFSLQNVLHTEAIQYLKTANGLIRFIIISCPGTLI